MTQCLGSKRGNPLSVPVSKGPLCVMSRIWGGIPGEAERLQGSHRAQVCVSALQVLLSGRLEGSELASLCSSPDWELRGRSPVHTGPVEH